MDYQDIMKTAVIQGTTFGCIIWLTIYAVNRGWLFFKSVAS